MVHQGCVQSTPLNQLRDPFMSNLRSGSASEAPPTSDRRQKVPLKWLMVQPMRIVLLIANGGPLYSCHFRDRMNQIYPWCPGGGTLNTALTDMVQPQYKCRITSGWFLRNSLSTPIHLWVGALNLHSLMIACLLEFSEMWFFSPIIPCFFSLPVSNAHSVSVNKIIPVLFSFFLYQVHPWILHLRSYQDR